MTLPGRRPGAASEEHLRRVTHHKPTFDLRSTWSYNNVFFTIGGLIPSRLDPNITFRSFLQAEIFDRLSLKSTGFDMRAHRQRAIAQMDSLQKGAGQVRKPRKGARTGRAWGCS